MWLHLSTRLHNKRNYPYIYINYTWICGCVNRDVYYLRHSGSMHFSTCSNSSVQSPSSTGEVSLRCRVLKPFPQVTLQSLQSDHGVSMQGIVSIQNSHAVQHPELMYMKNIFTATDQITFFNTKNKN